MSNNVNTIYFDGINFTPYVNGIDDIRLEYQSQENIIGYGVTQLSIQVMKDAYDYLYDVFFSDACAGRDATVDVSLIVNSCCTEPIEFNFVINHEGVVLREAICIIDVDLIAQNDCQLGYEYLRDTPFFDDGYTEDVEHGKLNYCVQPRNFYLFWMLGQFLFVFLVLFQIIESIFELVFGWLIDLIIWLDFLPKNINDALENFGNTLDVLPSLDNYMAVLTGCGDFHYTSGVKELLDYNFTKAAAAGGCDITLSFPILDSLPYSNLAIVHCNEKEGVACESKPNTGLFHQQKFRSRAWNRTALQIINDIKEVFAMEAILLPDGTFLVDTYENLVNGAPNLVIAENVYTKGGAEEPPAYKFFVAEYYASTQYSFAQDSFDNQGNRLLRGTELNSSPVSAQYSEIVKWDEDGSSASNRVNQKNFNFGGVRGILDIESFVLDGWADWDAIIDTLRSGEIVLWGDVSIPLLPAWFLDWAGDVACLPQKKGLILGDKVCSHTKLVILEDVTDKTDTQIASQKEGDINSYNRPLHLDNNAEYPELIQGFHEQVDNPSHPYFRHIEMEDYTIKMTNDMLSLIKTNGTYVGVITKYGKGIPETVELDFSNCTITLRGVKLKCAQIIP